MNINTMAVGFVALLIGLASGYFIAQGQQPVPMVHNMGSAMDDMMSGLQDKTGDDFDKAFLSEMIMHHQGAVEMAEAALQSAKHQEIKDMARTIISTQTSEINQMQTWGKSWYNE